MPVNWSPLAVSDALDIVDNFLKKAEDPLLYSKMVVAEAQKIPGIPDYVCSDLKAIFSALDKIPNLREKVAAAKNHLPQNELKQEIYNRENNRKLFK